MTFFLFLMEPKKHFCKKVNLQRITLFTDDFIFNSKVLISIILALEKLILKFHSLGSQI